MIEPLDVFIGSPRVRRDGAHTVIHLPDNVKFQRPILLQPQALCRHIRQITPEGDAADLIRSHGLGWCVPPTDIAGIAQALRQMLAGNPPENAHRSEQAWPLFERREQTRQLAALFNQLMPSGR